MMRYKLVIAEKPSVAQSLAAVIGATARKVQQILKPAERAEKAADKSSQQNADENQHSCDIIGKLEL